MMQITEQDYNQYMFLLESAIKDYSEKINSLYISIDKLQNNNSIYGEYKRSLTIEEMQVLAESFTTTQHEYFKKWYHLNKTLRQKGLPYSEQKRNSDCTLRTTNSGTCNRSPQEYLTNKK